LLKVRSIVLSIRLSFFLASFVTTVHLGVLEHPKGANAKLSSVLYFPFSATAPKVARRPL